MRLRFGTAAITGQTICLVAGALLFASNPKTRWPYLLAASFFLLNEAINYGLASFELSYPATEIVGSFDPHVYFCRSFCGPVRAFMRDPLSTVASITAYIPSCAWLREYPQ
jgi:hypothetical protein